MSTAAITLLGLGPGNFQDLTLHAYTLLKQAAYDIQTVYFRTLIHPTVEPLQRDISNLRIESFDRLYEESENWQSLYQQIADEICRLAVRQPVIYAVPGHPLIGESSVQLILQQAQTMGLSTRVVGGLSFLEPVCSLLNLDPFDNGTQILDATSLASLSSDEIAGKLIPTIPLLVTQVYNRRLASAVKIGLSDYYPDEWSVKLVRAAGVPDDEAVLEMPLYELDHHNYANHLSTLYIPPVDTMTSLRLPETQRYITMRLRRDPDGCPWDRQQTHQSLTQYVIEEAYEVVEAIEENDMDKLAEELGDLLLQVYLHAEIARQDEEFSIGDVYEQLNAKLIRRHPHVFGNVNVNTSGEVVLNWEEIKKQERAHAGKDVEHESVLDGIPLGLPALTVAQKYQKRVVRTGFEFSSLEQVYEKLQEELQELKEAQSPIEQFEEMGDILFISAKIARFLHIEAEEALRSANRKFRQRFQTMEMLARQDGRELLSYTPQEWDTLWQRAKAFLLSNSPIED